MIHSINIRFVYIKALCTLWCIRAQLGRHHSQSQKLFYECVFTQLFSYSSSLTRLNNSTFFNFFLLDNLNLSFHHFQTFVSSYHRSKSSSLTVSRVSQHGAMMEASMAEKEFIKGKNLNVKA